MELLVLEGVVGVGSSGFTSIIFEGEEEGFGVLLHQGDALIGLQIVPWAKGAGCEKQDEKSNCCDFCLHTSNIVFKSISRQYAKVLRLKISPFNTVIVIDVGKL